MLIELVTDDPRVDSQCEMREGFYAFLAARTRLDLALLEQALHAMEPDSRSQPRTFLCLGTLGALAVRGDPVAASILRRYVEFGTHVGTVVRDLGEAGRADLLEGCDEVLLSRFKGDEVELRDILDHVPKDVRRDWMGRQPALAAAWERRYEFAGSREHVRHVSPTDGEFETRPLADLLMTQARLRPADVRRFAAAGLRRWGAEFAPEVGAFLFDHERGVRRANAVRVLLALPEDATRASMLHWAESTEPRSWRLGAMLLAKLARAEDLDLLRSLWNQAWAQRNESYYPACDLVEAFGRVPARATHGELLQAYEELNYSYGRALAVQSLAATSSEFAGSALARECLWDCEATTRRVGVLAVRRDDPAAVGRLEEIAGDALEDRETRQAAKHGPDEEELRGAGGGA